MQIQEILQRLPHRYPILLVDRVLELEPGQRVVALKNVSANEPHFQGHFPGLPIMPGVLILEAMAQAGAIAMLSLPENEGKIGLFAGLDKVRFRRQVTPGDQLRLEVQIVQSRGRLGKGEGRAYVDGQLAAEAELTFAIADREAVG